MGSFSQPFSTAAPVLTLSPQPSHQGHFANTSLASQQAFSHSPTLNQPSQSTSTHQVARSAPSGRKRSRDEAAPNLDTYAQTAGSGPSDSAWVYGEGMTLLKSGTAYVADASSQSGTWLDEQLTARQQISNPPSAEAQVPVLRSRKSVRVDHGASAASLATPLVGQPQASSARDDHPSAPADPVVDDFTLQLGIGWRRIGDEAGTQAAARGWARYIENHFPLSKVEVRLESKGLQSYLVEASEGFYLFTETLRHGQKVSSTVEGTLRNLQQTPPSFDGSTILTAAESPQAFAATTDLAVADVDMKTS